MNIFGTWNDFINSSENYQVKINILRKSKLLLDDPQALRQLAWVALVNPVFASESLKFYAGMKAKEEIEIPILVYESIKKDVSEVYNNSMMMLKTGKYQQRLELILSYFAIKRPDIGYHRGMSYIAGFLISNFSIEADAFIMLSHILENIYPDGYFSSENRCLSRRIEYRIFYLLLEKYQEKILRNLRARYSDEKNSDKKFNLLPFEINVLRVAQCWLDNLLTTSLLPKFTLRLWDQILTFGFEFLHKFSLELIGNFENALIESIKIEAKKMKDCSTDSLILAGNRAFKKNFSTVKKLNIEKMIFTIFSKEIYSKIQRDELLQEAQKIEEENYSRLTRLRKTKHALIRSGLNISTYYLIINSLPLENSKINLEKFIEFFSKTSWDKNATLNFFNTIDLDGSETLETDCIKLALTVLFPVDILEKLKMLYSDSTETMEIDKFFKILSKVELFLDPFSRIFQIPNPKILSEISKKTGKKIQISRIPELISKLDYFEPLVNLIELVNDDSLNINDYSDSEIGQSPKYSNIHSPIASSFSSEFDDDNFLELEKRVSGMTENLEKNKNFEESKENKSKFSNFIEENTEKKKRHKTSAEKIEAVKKNSFGDKLGAIEKRGSLPENIKKRNSFRDKVNHNKKKSLNELLMEASTKYSDPAQFNTERVIKIEIPPVSYVQKARNCSRECSKDKCIVI